MQFPCATWAQLFVTCFRCLVCHFQYSRITAVWCCIVRSSETIVIFHLKTYVKLLSTLGLRKYFVSFVDTETEARNGLGAGIYPVFFRSIPSEETQPFSSLLLNRLKKGLSKGINRITYMLIFCFGWETTELVHFQF